MEVTRIFDLLENYKSYSSMDVALSGKENGQWKSYNSQDYIEKSNLFSYGLLALGYKKGDKIATICNNRPEWNFIDMGVLQIGVIHIPIYPTISNEDYQYILKQSQPGIILLSDHILYEKMKPVFEQIEKRSDIYTINITDKCSNWNDIIELGKINQDKLKEELIKIKSSIKPDDVATIIYTSGTTGFPKGVMLSHNNIISNFKETAIVHDVGYGDKALSFLPLCHIYERMMNYHYQFKGISIYYAENMGTIADNLKEVQPEIFTTVPRILEMFYDKIISKGRELPFLQRMIFFWSVSLGQRFDIKRKYRLYYNLKLAIARKIIFSKWVDSMGGKIKLVVSGGASLQLRMAKIFWAAQIHIIEGYGLTETSPVIAVNRPNSKEIQLGTVGQVLNGVTVKIADDGEILCKGHNVMLGYYNASDLTQQVIDAEGWFHTGDVGIWVDNTYLKITDRKKEIFKLSSGKYVAPQVIENKLKESHFIGQVCVIGENQKFASALISPNFTFMKKWSENHKINYTSNKELINHEVVVRRFQKAINDINKNLGQTEHIKRIRLVDEEWSPQTGELSPSLKLKRKVISEKYKTLIQDIYKADDGSL